MTSLSHGGLCLPWCGLVARVQVAELASLLLAQLDRLHDELGFFRHALDHALLDASRWRGEREKLECVFLVLSLASAEHADVWRLALRALDAPAAPFFRSLPAHELPEHFGSLRVTSDAWWVR